VPGRTLYNKPAVLQEDALSTVNSFLELLSLGLHASYITVFGGGSRAYKLSLLLRNPVPASHTPITVFIPLRLSHATQDAPKSTVES
jgi:hypothetical protein